MFCWEVNVFLRQNIKRKYLDGQLNYKYVDFTIRKTVSVYDSIIIFISEESQASK